MYTHGWLMLMYGRNQHNTVKQLSPNKIFLKRSYNYHEVLMGRIEGWDDAANENTEGSRSGSVTGESLTQPRGHSWGLYCTQLNPGTGMAGQP